jgi:hypothetical protein
MELSQISASEFFHQGGEAGIKQIPFLLSENDSALALDKVGEEGLLGGQHGASPPRG